MNCVSFFGSIGVGKTTLGQKVAEVLKSAVFIPEDLEENIHLDKFYANMKKWGFLSTLEMLLLMANQFDKIPHSAQTVILDNGIAELICYATFEHKSGILNDDEFYTYQRLYRKLLQLTPTIDLFVYLYCSEGIQLKRIAQRGRPYEASINRQFLAALNREYMTWVDTLPQDKLIRISTERKVDISRLAADINQRLPKKV